MFPYPKWKSVEGD